MKRGRVLDISDCCVHVTHRCHDRHFLLRFAVDRRDFNRRKQRSGAYWSDRFSPTLIENGCHLSRCLFYIGLNMVRKRAMH